MKKLFTFIITLLIFGSAITLQAGPATTYGNLQIIFSSTYNSMTLSAQNGNPVQLRGMSSMGLQWYPWGAVAVTKLASDWGTSVVRAAMYVGEGGYTSDATGMTNKVKTIVDAAIAADIYVIVDWHILSDNNPKNNYSLAKEYFTSMSKLYGGYKNVIWEICNEPNGSTTWQDIKEYATGWSGNTGIVDIIRTNDPDSNKNIIIVGTPNWSQMTWKANADPINAPNIMYAFHFYASSQYHDFTNHPSPEWGSTGIPELAAYGSDSMHDGIGWGADVTLSLGNIALFVTEWGVCEETGGGTIDLTKADFWVQWMTDRNISWTNWSLCNKGEAASALTGSGSAETGWNDATDLTQSGQYVKGKIKTAGTPSTPGPTLAPTPTPGPTPLPGSGDGLSASYYSGSSYDTLAFTRIDPKIDFSWGSGSPDSSLSSDLWSIRWTGSVEATYTEPFTFYESSDDGCRLYIDNQLVIDKWSKEAATEYATSAISLTAGQKYSILVEYYEDNGDASMILSWSSSTQAKEIIPQSRLYSASGNTPGPTAIPTAAPTLAPTAAPTAAPTSEPTAAPTLAPTAVPTAALTAAPTAIPTAAPTLAPTAVPTVAPTAVPTAAPTIAPTAAPTLVPTAAPTAVPTEAPIIDPDSDCVCPNGCNSTTVIASPFTMNGNGEFCFESTNIGDYINSWNTDTIQINGTAYTNQYVASGSYPASINGKWFIYYKSASTGGHMEIVGAGSTAPPAETVAPTPEPTAVPTSAPTAAPTLAPTAVPTAAPTLAPTAAPTLAPTANPTAVPTQAPTAVPTAVPSAAPGSLKIQYKIGGDTSSDSTIKPYMLIVNSSGSAISLSEYTIRYYYSKEPSGTDALDLYNATCGVSNITYAFGGNYIQYGFATVAGTLANGSSAEIQCAIHTSDWGNFDETNDYSYDSNKTAYADATKITLYRNGTLIWGAEPTGADPTSVPTAVPTVVPTAAPTSAPTTPPTAAPTTPPTAAPTLAPTSAPTAVPVSGGDAGSSDTNPVVVGTSNVTVDLTRGYAWIQCTAPIPQRLEINFSGTQFNVKVEYNNGANILTSGLQWCWQPTMAGAQIAKITLVEGGTTILVKYW